MKLKNLLKRIGALLLCLPLSILIYLAYRIGYFGHIDYATPLRIIIYISMVMISTLIVVGFAYGFYYAFRKDDVE